MTSRHSLYMTWAGLLGRCFHPHSKDYPRYGGQGITVCERWLVFANFVADMGERPAGHTLDRIDNGGNYEPGNCRWATPREQALNRRTNRRVSFAGQTLTLAEWDNLRGWPQGFLGTRLRDGWTVEEALSHEPRTHRRPVSYSNARQARAFRGITPLGRRWQAQIQQNRCAFYLGLFDSPEAAARAYDAKARELFGDRAFQNFKEKRP